MDITAMLSAAQDLFRSYDMEQHLALMAAYRTVGMSESQFAQFLGRCRLSSSTLPFVRAITSRASKFSSISGAKIINYSFGMTGRTGKASQRPFSARIFRLWLFQYNVQAILVSLYNVEDQ